MRVRHALQAQPAQAHKRIRQNSGGSILGRTGPSNYPIPWVTTLLNPLCYLRGGRWCTGGVAAALAAGRLSSRGAPPPRASLRWAAAARASTPAQPPAVQGQNRAECPRCTADHRDGMRAYICRNQIRRPTFCTACHKRARPCDAQPHSCWMQSQSTSTGRCAPRRSRQ